MIIRLFRRAIPESLRHPLLGVFAGIILVVSVAIYFVMVAAQRELIEYQAINIAEVVARQAAAARSVYGSAVVEKLRADGFGPHLESDRHKGFVPLPAQFLKLVGKASSADNSGLYRFKPLSKWNLESSQGLSDDFQRWAWSRLEGQDQAVADRPIPWQPAWRIEVLDNVKTLRYIRADPASAQSCVQCHNDHEQLPEVVARRVADGVPIGKQWRQHQLLGAIEVNIPIERVEQIASAQARHTVAWVLSLSLIGFTVAAWVAFLDIRQKQALAARFARQAKYDPLTQLPNRTLFFDRANEALVRAHRAGSVTGILFLDLDNFKNINDSLGHAAGDELLRLVAERLGDCMREVDTIARPGGDEFTVLLDGLHEPRDAARVAQKLLDAMALPFMVAGRQVFISSSIGISCYPQDGENVETLVKHADAAMYQAKEHGRNGYQFFSAEMNAQALAALDMTNKLRLALDRDELILHYQPRIDLASGRITAVEALIRWQHPEDGLIYPGQFVPLAEETGMIESIGTWVLEQACKQAKAWLDAGIGPMRIAVNLSARQFRQALLLEHIPTVLAETGLRPQYLELEITESMVMQDLERSEQILAQLNGMGITLSVDDFGTGYSSLGYLKRFPIDHLKIDKTFIDGIPDDTHDCEITKAIIAMAKSLGLTVVAEGVENQAQYDFLKSAGCSEIQGYLFCRPGTAQELETLFSKQLAPASSLGRG